MNKFEPEPKNLLVVGGAGGMGMWLVLHVFGQAHDIERITVADILPLSEAEGTTRTNPDKRDLAELARLKKPIDAVRLDYNIAGDDFMAEWKPVKTSAEAPASRLTLQEYDLIMLSVPEAEMQHSVAAILPSLMPGAWVFDVCSSKKLAIDTMLQHAPEGISVTGTHPLFGPAVPDAIGQTFIIVPTQRTDAQFVKWFGDLLRSFGAIVEAAQAEEHDRYMLFVQTLTHYAYMVFGKTLTRAIDSDFNFKDSFRFSTPPYGILTAFTARIIGINPALYAQIQQQPGADKIRALLRDAAAELGSQLDAGGQNVANAIKEIVEPLKFDDVARAYANSIPLVDSVQQSYRELFRRKQSGELTILLTRDPLEKRPTSHLHVGLVTDINGLTVELVERQAIVADKWYLAYDVESEEIARKAGKSLRAKSMRIDRRKIRKVYTAEETRCWRIDNLNHHRRDIAVLIDEGVDINFVCEVLTQINRSVVSGTVSEPDGANWVKSYGMHNKILQFTIFGDRNPDKCVLKIKDSLRLLGIRTHGMKS